MLYVIERFRWDMICYKKALKDIKCIFPSVIYHEHKVTKIL